MQDDNGNSSNNGTGSNKDDLEYFTCTVNEDEMFKGIISILLIWSPLSFLKE